MRQLLIVSALIAFAACVPVQNGTCTDGLRNGEESDVDCGGPSCSPCASMRSCLTHSDCETAVCARGMCVGGSCGDGVRNGTETDVDCGGAACRPCATDRTCASETDCESSVCVAQHCAPPSCGDQHRNGTETDLDCGGTTCPPCALNEQCLRNSDCAIGACVDAHCTLSCDLPLLVCGPGCVDPRVDPMNCGGCNMPCPPGGSCVGGQCQAAMSCPSGTRACGPACFGLDDVFNCGGCGMACNPGERCVADQCQLVCGTGQTLCAGECVRTMSDVRHCGGCGRPCETGQVCASGTCAPSSCSQPLSLCNGGTLCVDVRVDPDHCGGCGQACPVVPHATRVCENFNCSRTACDPGFVDCNQSIVDGCEAQLMNDPMNCGVCGRQCLGGPCVSGQCP
jgi:hypothetical protein